MLLRRTEIDSSRVPSLYIGGGTPSQLSSSLLVEMFQAVMETFSLADDAEVTIEVNPDDVSPQLIAALRQTPVNRISMGVLRKPCVQSDSLGKLAMTISALI